MGTNFSKWIKTNYVTLIIWIIVTIAIFIASMILSLTLTPFVGIPFMLITSTISNVIFITKMIKPRVGVRK